jgi:hypothetical protein
MCRLSIKYAMSTLLTGGAQAILQAVCPSTPVAGLYDRAAAYAVCIITRTLLGKLPLHANATQTADIGAQGDCTGNQH